jgi:transposase
MQLTTILNRVEKHKSFVYRKVTWRGEKTGLEIHVAPRRNGRPICAGCRRPGPIYDHQPRPRRFTFVPLWGLAVCLVYRMRRVDCRTCGVTIEQVPWGDGKQHTTTSYRWFLATWARRLSWSEVGAVFGTSWQTVFRSVRYAVMWGIANDSWNGVRAIGIDEIAWKKGHHYLTLVYQIDEGRKRLLFVARERTKAALEKFFDLLSPAQLSGLEFVVSDMWQPYLDVVQERTQGAVHVLDRYHIMATMNKAIDQIRRDETRRLKADGYEPVLKHSRWCLLKRSWNLTDKETAKISEILQYNLRTVRGYLHREEFQRFWEYRSAAWAEKFLEEWTRRVMRSRLEPLKAVARSLRRHRELLLNWFHAKGVFSAGVVEGFNNKAKLTMKKAYGFRTSEGIQIALYHTLGKLPEPRFTHRFW